MFMLNMNMDHVEGRKEGRKEGRREGIARAHTFFTDAPPETAPEPPDEATFAAHPDWVWRGELCVHPLTLWASIAKSPSRNHHAVFFGLATQHDHHTNGHGWYWVGIAMIAGATTGKLISSPQFIVATLNRWSRDDSYGSDTEAYREAEHGHLEKPHRAESAVSPAQTGAGASYAPERVVVPPTPLEPVSEALSASAAPHPAVAAYIATFGRTPNAEQTRRIIETVTDLPTWQTVLGEWQANDWKPGSVGGMLDRYGKHAPATGANGEPLSIMPIYTHPNLSDDVRSDWMGRWHATPKHERAALLARLEREHPIEPQKQETP